MDTMLFGIILRNVGCEKVYNVKKHRGDRGQKWERVDTRMYRSKKEWVKERIELIKDVWKKGWMLLRMIIRNVGCGKGYHVRKRRSERTDLWKDDTVIQERMNERSTPDTEDLISLLYLSMWWSGGGLLWTLYWQITAPSLPSPPPSIFIFPQQEELR
jgi:hypothetical protein